MDTGYSDVIQAFHTRSQQLCCHRSLFSYRHVGCARTDYQNVALVFVRARWLLSHCDDAGHGIVFGFGYGLFDRLIRRFIGARGHHQWVLCRQVSHDLNDLFRCFPRSEHDFGNALPQDPMMVQMGVTQVLIRKVL